MYSSITSHKLKLHLSDSGNSEEEHEDARVSTQTMIQDALTMEHGPPPAPVKFLEIFCGADGRIRRFAAGTKAGYALERINRKLPPTVIPATCIEAVKDGEEPVGFGPTADLVIYGADWRLQTLHEGGGVDHVSKTLESSTHVKKKFMQSYPEGTVSCRSKPKISVQYLAKVKRAMILDLVVVTLSARVQGENENRLLFSRMKQGKCKSSNRLCGYVDNCPFISTG